MRLVIANVARRSEISHSNQEFNMPVATRTLRSVHLASRPDAVPTLDNFKVVEDEISSPAKGEFLVRNEWISVDPYMRGRMRDSDSYVPAFQIGEPMEGGCVGRVIESQCPDFNEGDYVVGNMGWRDHWLSTGEGVLKVDAEVVSPQTYLGVLGMTGMTAYVGLNKIGKLIEGDTVFVSAASGAVGSIVCQIAKLKNCKVIGSAGSQAKIDWLKNEAGIDAAFNYHEVSDVSAKLKELCPDGIDLYFDNVGGDHLEAAIDSMKNFGKIVCCGMISSYNDSEPQPGPKNIFRIIGKRLRMQGFIVRDHMDQTSVFQRDMTQWIKNSKIKWRETVTEGLENAPQAFIDLFTGDKIGKSLVKLS